MTATDGVDSDASGFRPVKAAAYWAELEPVVVSAVTITATRTSRDPKSLYPFATALALWAWQTKGIELTAPKIFRKRVVEEFVHRGMNDYSRSSRATYRSVLMAIVDAVTPVSEQPFRIPRSAPTRPYSDAEVAALRSWANHQGSPQRRLDASVLLALGFGAGLATRELLSVRCGDVHAVTGATNVTVWDGRPRTVPILTAWDGPIREAVAGRDADGWLFRPGRQGVRSAQVTDFLHRGQTTELDVHPVRMRTTWILNHLRMGTPARDLLRIAGLENLAALDRLTAFLPPRAAIPHRR